MAAKKIFEIEVSMREAGAKQVSSAVSKATQDLSKFTEEEKRAYIESIKLKAKNEDLAASFRAVAMAELEAANNGEPLRASAGLNNAILLETSRLASDANYGFTGMANNIGQLVSLFQISAQNAGGFRNTLKQLVASLMGTGGILIAIQLLISFLPRLEKAFKNAGDGVTEFDKKVQDATKSIEEQLITVERLSRRYDKFFDLYNAGGLSVKLLSEEFTEFRNGLEKLEKQGNLTAISQKILIDQFIELLQKRKALKAVRLEIERIREEMSAPDFIDVGGKMQVILLQKLRIEKELMLRLIELNDIFAKETGTSEEKISRIVFKIYEKRFADLSAFVEKARKKELNQMELTELQKLQLQQDFAERELYLKNQTLREEEKIRYEEYLNDIELQKQRRLATAKDSTERVKIEQEAAKAIQDGFNKHMISLKQLTDEYVYSADKISESYFNIISNFLEFDELSALQQFADFSLDQAEATLKFAAKINEETGLFDVARAASAIDSVRGQMEVEELRHNRIMSQLQKEKAARESEGLSTLAIQQKIQNQEKKYSQEKINLKVRERDAILAITNQLGQAILANLEEGSNAQKAVSIALATINTYEAATAALGMKPYTPANIAQAAAVVLAGLAQVKNIVNTKLPNEKGAASTVNVAAPDFNVVGASPESQLLQTVAISQQKPLRAYVVSKDITSAQGFDYAIETMIRL